MNNWPLDVLAQTKHPTPSLISLPNIEQSLLDSEVDAGLSARSAYHLNQLTLAAAEFLTHVQELIEGVEWEELVLAIIRLQTVGETIKFHADELDFAYPEVLAQLAPDVESEDGEVGTAPELEPPDEPLADWFHGSLKVLEAKFENFRVQEHVAGRFAGHLLELSEELLKHLWRAEHVREWVEKWPDDLDRIWIDLVFDWSQSGSAQALSHLGGFRTRDASLVSPGFLGWAPALLEELGLSQGEDE